MRILNDTFKYYWVHDNSVARMRHELEENIMSKYEIEIECKHANAYMNESTGVMRCPTCQCTRHRIYDGITAISGHWEWRRYGTYNIDSKAGNAARLASIEARFN